MGRTILEALIFLLKQEARRTASTEDHAKAMELAGKLETIRDEELPKEEAFPVPEGQKG